MPHAAPEPPSDRELSRLDLNKDLEEKDRPSRIEAAIGMRIEGAPYSEIARTLEYASAHQARVAVERGLSALATPDGKDQLRFLESRRLERLLRSLWSKATDPDNDEHLAAARTALAVIDRHARLHGIDAPQEMVVYNPTQIEMQKWIEQWAGNVRSAFPDEVDIVSSEVIADAGRPELEG